MVTKAEAIERVEALINEPDLDWPTKQRHAVYDDLTVEKPWGWVLFYTVHEDFRVAHRDRAPEENPPYLVAREDGRAQLASTVDVNEAIDVFERTLAG